MLLIVLDSVENVDSNFCEVELTAPSPFDVRDLRSVQRSFVLHGLCVVYGSHRAKRLQQGAVALMSSLVGVRKSDKAPKGEHLL